VFGEALAGVLPASSRDILKYGPDPEALRAAVKRTQASLTPSALG
jgi:orotidine-5'-phosphate decarboxylase